MSDDVLCAECSWGGGRREGDRAKGDEMGEEMKERSTKRDDDSRVYIPCCEDAIVGYR